jgi:hypothetical protein
MDLYDTHFATDEFNKKYGNTYLLNKKENELGYVPNEVNFNLSYTTINNILDINGSNLEWNVEDLVIWYPKTGYINIKLQGGIFCVLYGYKCNIKQYKKGLCPDTFQTEKQTHLDSYLDISQHDYYLNKLDICTIEHLNYFLNKDLNISYKNKYFFNLVNKKNKIFTVYFNKIQIGKFNFKSLELECYYPFLNIELKEDFGKELKINYV